MKKITFLLCVSSFFSFAQTIGISPFASGIISPTEITHAGDSRLFVVQQQGAIRIVNADGTVNPTNFLTLTNEVINYTGSEQGLLGLAFHPDYANNGFFYIDYTRAGDGDTVLERFSVSATDPNVADPDSGTIILTIDQPAADHNGGTLKFGPDGYLYISSGDGGGPDTGASQNINLNLGKILRIDVDGAFPYAIPPGNPYAATDGNDEIWALGLRNPWKFSFDKSNGDLWIGDVGLSTIEEVNHVSGTAAGVNFGWRCFEGNIPFPDCAVEGVEYTAPVAMINHDTGACSVTGGYVYRGTLFPNLVGKYIFSDVCLDQMMMIDTDGVLSYSQSFNDTANGMELAYVVTMGQDVNGELYAASAGNGIIYKIIDTELATQDFAKNGFSLYPNPATSEVFIKNTSPTGLRHFQLYDLSGKLLLNQPLQGIETNRVNIGLLEKGMYLIALENVNGETYSSKLIVN